MSALVAVIACSVIGCAAAFAIPLWRERRWYERELRMRRDWYDGTTARERVQQREESPRPWEWYDPKRKGR